MSDQFSDPRSEQAFRDALARADEESFAPIDFGQVVSASRRRRDFRGMWAAVASFVAVAAVGGVVALGMLSARPTSTTAGMPAPAAGRSEEAASSASPVTDSGFAQSNYVSFLDVELQVPADWTFRDATSCTAPTGPYVELAPYRATSAVPVPACPDTGVRQAHLVWRVADPGDPVSASTTAASGWTSMSATVGTAFVTIEVPVAEQALGREILASARVVSVDHNGCTPTSPVQANPTAGTGSILGAEIGTVDAIAVCQYLTGASPGLPGPGQPALIGSSLLTGPTAEALWQEILAAPQGPGPATSGACAVGTPTVLSLHVTAGPQSFDLAVDYGCGMAGIYLGGQVRTLTPGNCSPLFTGSVVPDFADAAVARVCAPRAPMAASSPR